MNLQLLRLVEQAKAGQRRDALVGLKGYLQAYPEDVEAWIFLGGLAPDPKIALSALKHALQLAPDNAMAQRALGVVQARYHSSVAVTSVASDALSLTVPESASEQTETTAFVAGRSETEEIVLTVPAIPTYDVPVTPSDSALSSPFDGVPVISPDNVLSVPSDDSESDSTLPEIVAEVVEVPVPEGPPLQSEAQREARALVWPFQPRGQKNRPLGLLLDEGYVTRQDLIWAAENAKEAEVRGASRLILASTHRLPDVGMSLGQARLISWPYRRLNRPLGELVDMGTVHVKDLRRASWFAKDARLREAARLLLPAATKFRNAQKQKKTKQVQVPRPVQGQPRQPKSKPVPSTVSESPVESEQNNNGARSQTRRMPIIQGADYLTDQIQRRYQGQLILTAISLVVLFLGLSGVFYIAVRALIRAEGLPLWIWPSILVLILPLFWVADRMMELWQEEQNFRQGHEGEIKVARVLRQGLGGDWVLFRNLQIPGRKQDIDMILLGPPGIFALEIKTYSGMYVYHKSEWLRHSMTGWRKMHHNPGKQCRAGAGMLHQYITDTLGHSFWVEPRLVWVGTGTLKLESPEVFVWFMDTLLQETDRLRNLPLALSDEERALLSGLLRGLCSTLR
ncbi:MAG: NERD domain-containing protein [Anaerolineae bacterium]|nr:NERD domain-containing protein [Anaerolineae bacterium]